MQSDDAVNPDDPPGNQLFMKLRAGRCLTSDRKGCVGVKWRNSKIRSQTIQEPSEIWCTLLSSPLTARSLSQDKTVRKWWNSNLNLCTMNGALPVPNLICCLLHVQINTVRDRFSASHAHTHTFTRVTYGLTFGIRPSGSCYWALSVKGTLCIWRPAATNISVIGCSLLRTWPYIN